jgi:hypothetical protein
MKERYNEKGFCTLNTELPITLCEQIGLMLIKWQENQHIIPSDYGILKHNIRWELPIFEMILKEFSLQKQAEEIYGKKLILFQDNLIWKLPNGKTAISWHQDYSYWPLSEPRGITMWIALDNTDSNGGCMEMCIGSHNQGECTPNNFIQDKPAEWAPSLPPLRIDKERVHMLSMSQGSISVHHPLCAHTSGPNKSGQQRRAWSLTFVEPEIKWDPDHAPHPYNYWFNVQKGVSLCTLPDMMSAHAALREKNVPS